MLILVLGLVIRCGGDGGNVNGRGDVGTAAVVEVLASASLALL